MKKLLLITLTILWYAGAAAQDREMMLFMRPVQAALQPRTDIRFYKEKGEITDSLTGARKTVHTLYYFHKPTGKLRFVQAYHYTGKYPVIYNYYFAGDSLQKVGIFAHPKLCKGCYGVYDFTNRQLVGRQEAHFEPHSTDRLLLDLLHYELKAALLFKQPASDSVTQ
jgi:hypothetical protein